LHVSDEYFLRVVERAKEGRVLAVSGVDADPFKSHAPGACLAYDVQSVFGFRCQFTSGLRHPGQFASVRIIDPAPRQIKAHVDRCVALAIGQHPNTAT